jgi:hypothetical protein
LLISVGRRDGLSTSSANLLSRCFSDFPKHRPHKKPKQRSLAAIERELQQAEKKKKWLESRKLKGKTNIPGMPDTWKPPLRKQLAEHTNTKVNKRQNANAIAIASSRSNPKTATAKAKAKTVFKAHSSSKSQLAATPSPVAPFDGSTAVKGSFEADSTSKRAAKGHGKRLAKRKKYSDLPAAAKERFESSSTEAKAADLRKDFRAWQQWRKVSLVEEQQQQEMVATTVDADADPSLFAVGRDGKLVPKSGRPCTGLSESAMWMQAVASPADAAAISPDRTFNPVFNQSGVGTV